MATLLMPATIHAFRLPDTYEGRVSVRVKELSPGNMRSRLPEERTTSSGETVIVTPDRLFGAQNLRAAAVVLQPGSDPDDPRTLEAVRRRLMFDKQSPVSFSVRAVDTDPERASTAVNRLVRTFLESERSEPLRRADDTLAFRAQQRQAALVALEKASAELAAFDKANAETLPAQRVGLGETLNALRSEIDLRRRVADSAKLRLDFLAEQIARQDPSFTAPTSGPPTSSSAGLEERIRSYESAKGAKEQELAAALVRWTEKHPDVIKARSGIAVIDAEIAALRAAVEAARKAEPPATPTEGANPPTRALEFLEATRAAAKLEHDRALEAIEALRAQEAPLVARLARIPHTEADRGPLEKAVDQAERRHADAQKAHDDAAELADFFRLSDASDVTLYDVQQWASPALQPSGPPRSRIVLSALGMGAVIGYGLVLVRKRFHRATILRPEDLYEFAHGAMVVSVPLLPSGQPTRWRSPVSIGGVALGGWIAVCLAMSAVAFLAYTGWVPLPAWVHDALGIPA